MDDVTRETPGSNGHEPTASARDAGAGSADESFAWTAADEESSGGSDARATAERALAQLQSMIDSVATQAAPVVRQIGAKAAELAAVAADRAGPLAHKAADATAEASGRLAEKSRTWAADLRSRTSDLDSNGAVGDAEADSSSSVAVMGADDAEELTARDDPAEGASA